MIMNSVAGQLGIIDWNLSNVFWRSGSLFHVTCEYSITYNDLHKKGNVLPQPIQGEGDIGYRLGVSLLECRPRIPTAYIRDIFVARSEEHTSELQSRP